MKQSYATLLLVILLALQVQVHSALGDETLRIYNGEDAKEGEFPFMARITVSLSDDEFQCGGAIIDKRVVMTAAHCVMDTTTDRVADPASFTVIVGDTNQKTKEVSEQNLAVFKVIAHSDYDNAIANDIALLILAEDVDYKNGTVGEILLPPPYMRDELYTPDNDITVIGWGGTEDESIATQLQKLDYHIASLQQCSEYWGDLGSGKMCTYNKKGLLLAYTWSGDSGGPLFSKVGGKTYLLGLVSFGVTEVDTSAYDVNTDVGFYYFWVEKIMWEEGIGNEGNKYRVLLNGGMSDSEGIVLVWHPELNQKKAVVVCSDRAGHNEAMAVCRHLGYKVGRLQSYWNYAYAGIGKKEPPVLNDAKFEYTWARCEENATNIFSDCNATAYKKADTPCFSGDQLAVQCANETWSFTITSVRVKGKPKRSKVTVQAEVKKFGLHISLGGEVSARFVNVNSVGGVVQVGSELKYKARKDIFVGKFTQDGAEESEICLVALVQLMRSPMIRSYKVVENKCNMDVEQAGTFIEEWLQNHSNDSDKNPDEKTKSDD